jgi:hypothetical protein
MKLDIIRKCCSRWCVSKRTMYSMAAAATRRDAAIGAAPARESIVMLSLIVLCPVCLSS